MLKEKLKGRLVKTIISPSEALKNSGVQGAILSMDASWYRTMDGDKELVELASFAFLVSRGGDPLQVEVEFEKGEFKTKQQDLSKELGPVKEEEGFLNQVKLVNDAAIIEKLEKNARVKTVMRKAKHLRVASMSFVLFDEVYEAPVWQVVLKNGDLTKYFKTEKPMTAEVTLEAVRGNVLSFRQVI
ncbi:MAG: hypothetical protein GOV00_00620 [Candidatus Altiarchaeota archaeon]|nr:hypothetical protein [Candidatus Altiarchaeota archaeon]